MKIESILKRKGGTLIDLINPTRQYHFKPENGVHESPHVAEVEDGDHIKTLLRIKEGFRPLNVEDVQDVNDEVDDLNLKTSSVHNAVYTIKGGETVSLDLLVRMAFDDSGLQTEEAWNNLEDSDRYQYIDATLAELVEGYRPVDVDNVGGEGGEKNLNAGGGENNGDNNGAGASTINPPADNNTGAGAGDAGPTPPAGAVGSDTGGAIGGTGKFAGKTPDDFDKPTLQAFFKEEFKRDADPKMTKAQLWKAINPDEDED